MRTVAYSVPEFLVAHPSAPGPIGERWAARGDVEAVVITVEAEDGALLGYWPVWTAVHVDGLWVTPDVRTSPGVGRSLLEGLSATLHANQIRAVFAVIDPAADGSPDLATRAGFVPMPGQLYLREE